MDPLGGADARPAQPRDPERAWSGSATTTIRELESKSIIGDTTRRNVRTNMHEQRGSVLRVEGVSVRYGGVKALTDVSLTVEPGQVYGVIGPNGAGKTTLFDAICGTAPASGRVWLGDRELSRASALKRARLGIRRTFQRQQVFGGLTVHDNLLVAWSGGAATAASCATSPGSGSSRPGARPSAAGHRGHEAVRADHAGRHPGREPPHRPAPPARARPRHRRRARGAAARRADLGSAEPGRQPARLGDRRHQGQARRPPPCSSSTMWPS